MAKKNKEPEMGASCMTQNEIRELAKQVGIEEAFDLQHNQVLVQFKDGSLEAFAKLVAAKERERVKGET